MSTQFDIPAVGSTVTVTITQKHYSGYGTVEKSFTGTVVPNKSWVQPTSFTVHDGNPDWPDHIIPIDWVIDVKYADGKVATQSTVDNSVKTWEVDGSKPGVKYTVTKRGNKVTCSCPGFGFRKACKHTEIAK